MVNQWFYVQVLIRRRIDSKPPRLTEGIYWGQVLKPLRSHFFTASESVLIAPPVQWGAVTLSRAKKSARYGRGCGGGGGYWLIDPRPIISAIVTMPPIMAISQAY